MPGLSLCLVLCLFLCLSFSQIHKNRSRGRPRDKEILEVFPLGSLLLLTERKLRKPELSRCPVNPQSFIMMPSLWGISGLGGPIPPVACKSPIVSKLVLSRVKGCGGSSRIPHGSLPLWAQGICHEPGTMSPAASSPRTSRNKNRNQGAAIPT